MLVFDLFLFILGLSILISISIVFGSQIPQHKTTAIFKMNLQKPHMVTISLLKGGLGNQLFKIATAYTYAKNTDKELVFDVSEAIFPYPTENVKYFDSFYGWTKNIDITKYEWNLYTEKEGLYEDIPVLPKNVKLEGYFQSAKYFDKYKSEILDIFYNYFFTYVPLHLSAIQNPDINTVCVHFRYIDYVGNPQFDILPPNYYQKAITYIQQNISNPLFIIFSDQIDYCKQQLTGLNCIFVDQGTEIDQHIWMSLCKHHIIPNSTFSWWAAYKNNTGIVILPELWCNPTFGNVWEGLKLKHWITAKDISD